VYASDNDQALSLSFAFAFSLCLISSVVIILSLSLSLSLLRYSVSTLNYLVVGYSFVSEYQSILYSFVAPPASFYLARIIILSRFRSACVSSLLGLCLFVTDCELLLNHCRLFRSLFLFAWCVVCVCALLCLCSIRFRLSRDTILSCVLGIILPPTATATTTIYF
jgi:hypothetical protein